MATNKALTFRRFWSEVATDWVLDSFFLISSSVLECNVRNKYHRARWMTDSLSETGDTFLKIGGDRWRVFISDGLLKERGHDDYDAFQKVGSEQGPFVTIAGEVLVLDEVEDLA